MDSDLEILVEQAKEGDREALEQLVGGIQDRVYGLAMRMLSHPSDAEDATQEILVKTVTHLGEFRGESSFTTWVYRIACNHLLTTRKRRAERQGFTFQLCERHIDDAFAASRGHSSPDPEQGLLAEELMISCMQAILLSLNRDLRITYILCEVLELSSEQGADVLNISPVAFRKRVSRARTLVRDFMQKNCGLVNPSNRCKCARMVSYTAQTGWIVPEKPVFSAHPRRNQSIGVPREDLDHMDERDRVTALFRSHPDYIAPVVLLENLRKIMKSVRLAVPGDDGKRH